MRRLLPVALAVLAVGCRPALNFESQSDPLSPAGPPPDVVVLAVSGRCGPPCKAPRDNWDYLRARGTLDAVANVIAAQGYHVQTASYADNALDTFQPLKVREPQRGYAALVSDFAAMRAAWFGKSQQRPPRIVLLGHSHGSVWLHHLARVNPEVPFALQIDLDGICASWNLDHRADLAVHPVDPPGQPRAIDACNLEPVGRTMLRSKDVVWPNVARDLEVQSKRLPSGPGDSGGSYVNYLFEVTANTRQDGSSQGIERFVSRREDHSAVAYPNSEAMKWVLTRTGEIAAGWKAQDER